MKFASITQVQSDIAGAGQIEQAARRLWMQGKGEWFAETASVLREQRDTMPWVNKVAESQDHTRHVTFSHSPG